MGETLIGTRYMRLYFYIEGLIGFVFGIVILNAKINPSYKIVWLILVLLLSWAGIALYLMLGRNNRKNRRIHRYVKRQLPLADMLSGSGENVRAAIRAADPDFARIAEYVERVGGFPAEYCSDATYYESGEAFFEPYKEALRAAKHFIFMEFYIIDEGKMWGEVLEILEQKVSEGVTVRLVYDDFGNFGTLPANYSRILAGKGISCMVFNKFVPVVNMRLNNRTHRKITVIDGKVAFTGGLNLADEYINAVRKFGYWKDSAIRVTGRCVANFTAMFLQMWSIKHECEDTSRFFPALPIEEGTDFAVPFSDAFADEHNVAEDIYMSLLYSAKDYVYISTPYLLLDNEMRTAIVTAAKSGVDVRLLVPHIPDKKSTFWLTKAFYTELIDEGVKVYEFSPGFVHAKFIVSDDRVGVVGTTNMDFRSFYLNYECGVLFRNEAAAKAVRDDFHACEGLGRLMTKENTKVRLVTRMIRSMIRMFAPLM